MTLHILYNSRGRRKMLPGGMERGVDYADTLRLKTNITSIGTFVHLQVNVTLVAISA